MACHLFYYNAQRAAFTSASAIRPVLLLSFFFTLWPTHTHTQEWRGGRAMALPCGQRTMLHIRIGKAKTRQGHKKSQCAIKTVKAKTKVTHTHTRAYLPTHTKMHVSVCSVQIKPFYINKRAHILAAQIDVYIYL